MHGIIDFNCLSSSYLTFVRTIASRTSKLSYKRTPWFRVDLCNLWDIYSHGSHGWALIRGIFCSTSRAPPAKFCGSLLESTFAKCGTFSSSLAKLSKKWFAPFAIQFYHSSVSKLPLSDRIVLQIDKSIFFLKIMLAFLQMCIFCSTFAAVFVLKFKVYSLKLKGVEINGKILKDKNNGNGRKKSQFY